MSGETEHLLRVIGDSSSARQSLQELSEQLVENERDLARVNQAIESFEKIMQKAVYAAHTLTEEEKATVAASVSVGQALDKAAVITQRAYDQTVRAARSAADAQVREQKRVETEHGNSLRRMAQMAAQGAGLSGVSSALSGLGPGIAGLAAGVAIRETIEMMLKYTDTVKLVTQTTGESARESSTLLAVAQRLGVEYGKIADALLHVNQVAISAPQQFAALGIALNDNAGKARSSLDVFMQLREVFAGLPDEAAKSALAAEIFGSSWRDIMPFLTASQEEIEKLTESVQKSSLVMDEAGIKKADEWKKGLAELVTMVQEVAMTFSGVLVPVLLTVGQHIKGQIDIVGSFIGKLGELKDAIGGALQSTDLIPGIQGPTARRVAAQEASELKRENARGTRGTLTEEDERSATDALRRNIAERTALRRTETASAIDALRDMNTERHESMRDELELMRRSTAATVDAIEDQRRARNDAYRDRIEQIQDESERVREGLEAQREAVEAAQEAYERAQDARQDALEAQKRAAEDAYDATRRQRDEAIEAIEEESELLTEQNRARSDSRAAAIAGLRDQMRATDELLRMERMRKDLADSEHDLLVQKSIEVFRRRNETEEEYQERVFERNKRVREAEEEVAERRVDIENETNERLLEARIRALEAQDQAEDNSHREAMKRTDLRVAAIRAQMDQEATAHRNFLRAVEDRTGAVRREMEAHANETKERLRQISDELKSETERTQRTIEQIQRRQAAEDRADSDRVRALQRHLTAVTQNVNDVIKEEDRLVTAQVENIQEALTATETAASAKSAAEIAAAQNAYNAWKAAYDAIRALQGGGAGGGGSGGMNFTPISIGGGGNSRGSASLRTPTQVDFPNANAVGSPAYYATIAREIAVEAGIDPDRFVAQMYHESGLNPNARGAAGEVGIAQFMPGTAPSWGVTNRSDPIQSLQGAARYMRTALEQSGGNMANALAMYNGGFGYANSPGRAQAERYAQHVLTMNVYGLTAQEAAIIVAAQVGREMDAQAASGATRLS